MLHGVISHWRIRCHVVWRPVRRLTFRTYVDTNTLRDVTGCVISVTGNCGCGVQGLGGTVTGVCLPGGCVCHHPVSCQRCARSDQPAGDAIIISLPVADKSSADAQHSLLASSL